MKFKHHIGIYVILFIPSLISFYYLSAFYFEIGESRFQILLLGTSNANLSLHEVLQNRRTSVLKKCANHRKPINWRLFSLMHGETHSKPLWWSHLVVIEDLQVIYCRIPKVAQNSILTYLSNAARNDKGSQNGSDFNEIRYLSDYPTEKAQIILQNYTKIVFTRNPIDRFISAWYDKFHREMQWFNTPEPHFVDLAHKVINKLQKPDYQTARSVMPLGYLFEYFDKMPEYQYFDETWWSQSDICQFCSIDYDYYGEFENIQYEMEFLAKTLTGNKHAPPFEGNFTKLDENYRNDLKKLLNPDLLRRVLLKYYKLDYEFFEYDVP